MSDSEPELYFPEMSNDVVEKKSEFLSEGDMSGSRGYIPPGDIIRPEDLSARPRGRCGKKNCLCRTRFLGLPIPIAIKSGGSGIPYVDETKSLTESSELEWSYNNMIAYSRVLGWMIIRLQNNQSSKAVLSKIQVNGETKLTAIKHMLNLTILIPRFRLKFDVPNPLVLTLQKVVSERHFQFVQDTSLSLIRFMGVPIVKIDRSMVDVTPSSVNLLAIQEIKYTNELLSFRIKRDHSVQDMILPLAWFVHNPEETGDWIPVGSVKFNGPLSEIVEVDLSRYPNLVSANRLVIETVTLREPRHLWTFAMFSI